ncbi:MAG TPA: HipA domain-containing protein [Acidimicrobiales bacterium]|nr:HipA domain-containing protein [Acidimicrobiales bacterium]
MARSEPLAIWFSGEHVATLELRRGLRLTYTGAAMRRWSLNTPVVSLAMPVSPRPYLDRLVRPFFDGLLPEGEARRTLAYDLALSEDDVFGFLRALGRDCAGALVLAPLSEGPPLPASLSQAERITEDEVAKRLAAVRTAPLGVDDRVRVSLAGAQGKVVLTRLPDGSWALPVGGAPSTHILKPAVPGLEGSVENEAFCMRLAARVGLAAAHVEVGYFAGRPVLVVERFDREVTSAGEVHRLHQEDACQALSVPVGRKYEEDGGPSLRAIADLLRRWTAAGTTLVELCRSVVFAAAVGDADRHAKNTAFLHGADGKVRLAPLYDVMSTRFYRHVSAVPGTFVNGVRDIDALRPADFVAEAESWGLSADAARDAVESVLDALPSAISAEADASPWPPPRLVDFLAARARKLSAAARSPRPSAVNARTRRVRARPS